MIYFVFWRFMRFKTGIESAAEIDDVFLEFGPLFRGMGRSAGRLEAEQQKNDTDKGGLKKNAPAAVLSDHRESHAWSMRLPKVV